MTPSPENAISPGNPYYLWWPEGKPLAAYLSLAVAEDLFLRLTKTSETSPEFGGLLLGWTEQTAANEWKVIINRFEPFDVEYRYGPRFVLAPMERQKLEHRIAQLKSGGAAVVGLFRSHTRPGLYLDQKDFSLFQLFFPEAPAVCLLARREDAGDATAGFFYWEDGDVQRHATHLEFPLNPARLRQQPSAIIALEPKTALEPKNPPVDQSLAVPERRGELSFWPGAAPAPDASSGVAARPRWRALVLPAFLLLLIPLASFLLVRAIVLYNRQTESGRIQQNFSPQPRLVITAKQIGRALLLTWDPGSAAVRKADHAHLFVRDGQAQKQLWLDAQQLTSGRFSYEPAMRAGYRNVVFRMDTYTAPLHTQNLSAALADADTGPAVEPRSADSGPGRLRLRSRARKDPGPSRIATGETAITIQNKPPAAPEPLSTAPAQPNRPEPQKEARLADVPPPPLAHSAPVLPERPVLPDPVMPAANLPPPPVAKVTVEPAPPPRLREVVRRIPIVRKLQWRRYKGGDRFVPAHPIKPVAPAVPPDLTPGQAVRVDLAVKLDKAGKVLSVRYDPDAELAMYAASAVRRWQFEPARLNGSPVAGDLIVHVEFAGPPLQSRR